jgi:hypothetical protein
LWPEEVCLHARRRATALQAAIERLGDLRDEMIANLDALNGDADLEPECEDEGAACEDEGAQCDDEGAYDDHEFDGRNLAPMGAA